METTIRKLRNIFTKYDKDYFVLANLNHNAIFIFEKDVQAVWEILDEELSVEELLRRLQGKGYSVIAEDFYDLVEVMSKAGLIFNDQVSEDLEYISQNNSYESYIERCSSNNLPSILHIELTNGCNLKCIHCYHDEAIQSLNLDDIEHLFQNSENSSFVRVTLTGGEVFCYPHWREVVTMARQHGYIVSILSNITLLTERDIEFLKQSNISFIRTSLYGVNEKTHDLICTVDGSFNKTFNNILAL